VEHEVRRLLSGGCELWELVMTVCPLSPPFAHCCWLFTAEPAIGVCTIIDSRCPSGQGGLWRVTGSQVAAAAEGGCLHLADCTACSFQSVLA
jgi:hypothetical protein